MRKSDKKKSIQKANLLVEQRHAESNSLVRESFHDLDGTPIGVDSNHRPIKESSNSEYDLTDEGNLKNFMKEITGIMGKYMGTQSTNNAAVGNDNRVIIYNLLNSGVFNGKIEEVLPSSSLHLGSSGSEYYTNNPEAMTKHLNSIGITDFQLKNLNN